ncbi:MAG: hypothetical protein ACLQBY_13730 [Solirubrobacteraceae bacterium]
MVRAGKAHSPDQLELLRWTVRLGVITADALAQHGGWTLASARGRLLAAERAGLLRGERVLAGAPALYTVTRAGLRASGLLGFEPGRVSVANAPHALECARVAAALERAYPDHRVMGERELRRDEREAATPLASACLGVGPGGAPLLHRPDIVLWPDGAHERLPVAVEVELTIKAPHRLLEICRAWARCRCVAGTLYLAAPEVQRPLARAIERAHARERIVLVGIDALGNGDERDPAPAGDCVPSDA